MVKLIHNNGQPVRFNTKPTRNEICPCGSGKKFKNCHVANWDEFLEDYIKQSKISK